MDLSEPRKELALGLAIGLGIGLGFYLLKSRPQIQKPKQHSLALHSGEEDLLEKEQLIRLSQYFGQDKFDRVRNSRVAVFGLGGVGSHVVNMLVRSGVKNIRVVDFDRVSLSSLSRHAYALREDVGTPKTQCIKKYVSKIFSNVSVDAIEEYATKDNLQRLIEGDFDFVIDCIDSIDAKVQLSAVCHKKNIRLIVSGGAGMKNDATQLQIRDIADVRNDDLISAMRKKLYKLGIRKGITCVFSRQESSKELLPLNEQQQKDFKQYRLFDNYRVRIVPVLGTMPALIGQAIASYVLCALCDQPYKPFQADDVRAPHYIKIHNKLISEQTRLGLKPEEHQFQVQDVYILLRHIYKWKCFMSGNQPKQLYMSRWDKSQPASLYNMVPLCRQAYDTHMQHPSIQQCRYPLQISEKFKQGCREIKQMKEKFGFVIIR